MSRAAAVIIPLSAPHETGQEWTDVQRLGSSEWLRSIACFETDLCRATGVNHALATPSGTSALEMALRTLGIGQGDLVACPTLTFAATANAIVNVGATPVFVGSEKATWGICPDALETALKKIRKCPRAIIVVDLYGMPADWLALQRVADRFAVPLVADAAESLGSLLHGQSCGTMGVLNALSFNWNKIITAGGGGALLTDDPGMFARAAIIANQGRQVEYPYSQAVPGGNFRISPLNAAYGKSQLALLAGRVAARQSIFNQYYEGLCGYAGLAFQPGRAGAISNRWLTALIINHSQTGITAAELANRLAHDGIETRPVFAPLHLAPAFRHCLYVGDSVAVDLAKTGICLPSGSAMSEAEVEYVIGRCKSALELP